MKALLLLVAALCAPIGGYTSGFTRVVQQGPHYQIALQSPSISFVPEPGTHKAPEQDYHQRTHARYESLLTQHKPKIVMLVDELRAAFASKASFAKAYDPKLAEVRKYQIAFGDAPKGPCQVSFAIDYPNAGTLSLAFATPPSPAVYEEMATRVRALFSATAFP